MKLPTLGSIFRQGQPGIGVVQPPAPDYEWEDCIAALQKQPRMDLQSFLTVMVGNNQHPVPLPTVKKYYKAAAKEARARMRDRQPQVQAGSSTAGPVTGKIGLKQVQSGNVSLITYSPEELLQQVEEKRASISFGLSGTARFMDNYNQVWSWAGPILFALGTIGEIFIVLWERQRVQDWFTGFTIVAVSMIAEGTLLGVSFAAKRLRNRADKRSSSWTDKEKRKLETLKKFWFALAIGVAATQVAFVVAQTKSTDIGEGAVWAIALARSLVALVADCYTAFASEEKPTTGDVALEVQEQEIQFTKKALDQKAVEVETLNAGSVKVQEVGIKAEIAQDKLTTQKEIERLQNKAQIETMKTQHEQMVLFDRMRNSAMRAIFDPEMPDHERQKIIGTLSALMDTTKRLPPGHIESIREERDTGDL